ncbi:MAG: winged helix-turn-helix domain-containing protein [Candidatus Acidiferrales bacterium]
MEDCHKVFQFGPYELRPRTRELLKHGVKLRLRPQPFRILQALLERNGDVVTREELHKQLWPSDTFVDFERGLNSAVKQLRGVLGDSASAPRYIQTLPKLGYRIIVPVEANGGAPSNSIPSNAADPGPQSVIAAKGASSEALNTKHVLAASWSLLLGACVLLIAGAAYIHWSRPGIRLQASTGRLMIAVLPFENLTGDVSQDYFSDGLTEEMIAQLGHVSPERLGVIARTSVMQYKRNQATLPQIGHDLGVQYILEGSFRRDFQDVRITAHLIQVSDQKTVWARQYDRRPNDLLAVQEEIAQETADEIQNTLGGVRKRIAANFSPIETPTSYEAYDLYVKGRFFWNKRTIVGFQQAISYFQQAIAKDPSYARAYSGLADSYALTCSYNYTPPNDYIPKARAAALHALQLDNNLAEAHASLGLIAENFDWDWQTAGKEFRRAIQLDPNYPTAHQWYAEYLAWQGRFDEAFAESERARQLDPMSLIIATDHGALLYYSHQYDRAIEQFRTTLEMEPNFPRAHILMYAYVQEGKFDAALADLKQWSNFGDFPDLWAFEAYVYGREGKIALAQRDLAEFERVDTDNAADNIWIHVIVYAGMGDRDKMFAYLQEAVQKHLNILTALKADPVYDPYRSDPRFQAILRKVGLAP